MEKESKLPNTPFTLSSAEARRIVDRDNNLRHLTGTVEELLLDASLTPLQVQAALTAAWDWIYTFGYVSRQKAILSEAQPKQQS